MEITCDQHLHLIIPALLQHAELSFTAVAIGTMLAVPLGIYLAFRPRRASLILSITGSIQTIPSLALYGLFLPLLGIGRLPAITVLSLYSIMPILRGTFTSIRNVDSVYLETAKAMGMDTKQLLIMVLIPLSLPGIISGIRLSSIYIISWTTIAALIGAGGLGDLVLGGIYNYDLILILSGAIPSACFAITIGVLLNQLAKHFSITGFNQTIKEQKT